MSNHNCLLVLDAHVTLNDLINNLVLTFDLILCFFFTAKAASVLQSRLLGDRSEWMGAVMTWSHLRGELASRRTNDITLSTDLGGMRRGKEGRGSIERREEEEKCHVQDRNCTREQTDEESENRRLGSGEENRVQTLQKKRKRDSEEGGIEEPRDIERKWERGTGGFEQQTLEKNRKGDDGEEQRRGAAPDSSNEKNAEKVKTSMRERNEEGENQTGMFMKFSGVISGTHFNGGSACDHAAPGLDHSEESGSTDESGKISFFSDLNYSNFYSFYVSFQFFCIFISFCLTFVSV